MPPAPPLLPFDAGVALLVIIGLVLVGVALRLIIARWSAQVEEERDPPPLVYPVRRRDDTGPRPEFGPVAGDRVTYSSALEPPAPSIPEPPAARPAVPPPVEAPPHNGRNGAGEADITLQLLPGRLEPAGPATEQEIRFVRVPGSNRFTLGRNPGPLHTHVQLRSATASRMHAYMVYEDGRWRIGNMSRTNRVVVNGAPLETDEPHVLDDGDRVEFGELSFVFRDR